MSREDVSKHIKEYREITKKITLKNHQLENPRLLELIKAIFKADDSIITKKQKLKLLGKDFIPFGSTYSTTALSVAIEQQDEELVEGLIGLGVKVYKQDLTAALKTGNPNIARPVLGETKDINKKANNVTNRGGFDEAHLKSTFANALSSGLDDIAIEILRNPKFKLDWQDIHEAARLGKTEVLKEIQETRQNNFSLFTLQEAIKGEKPETIRFVLEHCNNLDPYQKTKKQPTHERIPALTYAMKYGSDTSVRILLEAPRIEITSKDFQYALETSNHIVYDETLKRRQRSIHDEIGGKSILYHALNYENKDQSSALSTKIANHPDFIFSIEELIMAIQSNNIEVAHKALSSKFIDINDHKALAELGIGSILSFAICNGTKEMTKMIANFPGFGFSPTDLMTAINRNQFDIVQIMMERGVDPNTVLYDKTTAADHAFKQNPRSNLLTTDMLILLMLHGAEVTAKSKQQVSRSNAHDIHFAIDDLLSTTSSQNTRLINAKAILHDYLHTTKTYNIEDFEKAKDFAETDASTFFELFNKNGREALEKLKEESPKHAEAFIRIAKIGAKLIVEAMSKQLEQEQGKDTAMAGAGAAPTKGVTSPGLEYLQEGPSNSAPAAEEEEKDDEHKTTSSTKDPQPTKYTDLAPKLPPIPRSLKDRRETISKSNIPSQSTANNDGFKQSSRSMVLNLSKHKPTGPSK